ncbi:RagB/SusD family nutrient uptake outer membrane protein [uncultured Bacteroides sp.]|uniref:RagB/SusD family nutrient uptake outer membrane protein n=1 Tax=uncultured Bacteroides sp. TaxID=162156 RepID=UPI002675E679|nr:RagB/SusD family nutrient uptake outer membrane protein [uncultured Bacteroides sp.]
MKLSKIIYTAALAAVTGISFSSCNDYLDVSKELSQNLNKDQVFSNWDYLKQWYGEIYNTMPNYSETGLDVYKTQGGFVGSWAIYSGELVCAHPSVLSYGTNTFTPSNTPFNRWASCYKEIRQAMIFLDRCPDTVGDPSDRTNYKDEATMRRYKADAVFLIAYNYFLMFELYGPTPIIEEVADPEAENLDYARASVDEMVQYIDGLLESVISGEYAGALPDTYTYGDDGADYYYKEMLRPSKIAAMALRARLWVYAASPLYNGGFEEALSLVDKSGKRLFPDYDAGKWQTAKERLEDLLEFARQNGLELYKSYDDDGTLNPHLSVYELFQQMNREIIWANPNNDYSSISSLMEARTAPYSLGYASSIGGNVGPYQELVDLFFTKNGLPIDEDPEYNEDGFTNFENPCTNLKKGNISKKHVDKHIFNMYVDREPRFYADITYQGKSWHIQPVGYADWGAYFAKSEKSSYKGTDTYARSGYLLYKFNNRNLMKGGSYSTSWRRPWIYFRLADFYLYYAEVCNEINPGDPNIIKYLDMVRERAGIPGYQELQNAGTKTDVIGSQDAQREAIYRERIIEMFGEGNYYFDMHRWMRAGWTRDESGNLIKDNEDKDLIRRGMDIDYVTVEEFTDTSRKVAKTFNDKIGEGSYYNRVVLDKFPWKKAMLFYPVPYNEMQKSELTVQNPLWDVSE